MVNSNTDLLRRGLNQVQRKSFEAFLRGAFYEMHKFEINWNWHHEVICDALFGIQTSDDKRLIINVPPRSLKSFICNIAWPAWLMGQNPKIKIISISYAQDLSGKFARDQRQLMSSEWYRQIFPFTKLNPKKSGESEFETTAGGFRLSTSTGGILTGRGADIIIIDDPIKPDDAFSETQRKNCIQWIEGTLMTRLDNKYTGVMVMIMQRLHEEDPTGYFLEKGGWQHLSFSAIALENKNWQLNNGKIISIKLGDLLHPKQESQKVLDDLKRDLGVMNFSSQYQQNPTPVDGNLVKREWFKYYPALPINCNIQHIISVDTAMKDGANNDWSVCTIWGKKQQEYYLVDVVRKRMNFPELQRVIQSLINQYQPRNILIEDTGSGTSLIQQLKANNVYCCVPCKPNGSKIERLASASIAFEQGKVFFPANKPDWLNCLEHELLSFPRSKYDDQVDSISQFLNWAITSITGGDYIFKLKGL